MALEIRETPLGGKLEDFLNVVDYVYRGVPSYVRPLNMEMKDRFSLKNPFFDRAEGATFTAYRNGWCVGRISAQLDREHLARYDDAVGFFGFLDTIDDEEVSQALLEAAGKWLRARDMKRMRGPLSLTLEEECGCLIEGFDAPSMVATPQHRPYQGGLIEQAGFGKLKDFYTWQLSPHELSGPARLLEQRLDALSELKARHIDVRNLDAELFLVEQILNDAAGDDWGVVPWTTRARSKQAADLKLIAIPELATIVEVNGEPAGVVLAVPNLNELIYDLKGSLVPLGLPKLLWRLKVIGTKACRIRLFAVRRKFTQQAAYAELGSFLLTKLAGAAARLGLESITLTGREEDQSLTALVQAMGGTSRRTLRLYEKAL